MLNIFGIIKFDIELKDNYGTFMRLIVNKDSFTAKTVANELIAKAGSIATKAKAHPDWRTRKELKTGTVWYTNMGFKNLNFNLRNDLPLTDDPVDLATYEDLMADMRPLSSPFTAYRLLDTTVNYKEGYTFTAKQFWSATLDLNAIRRHWPSVVHQIFNYP